ncbi:MAG: ribonuclease R [Humidesulfovibrio sp.]
MKKKNRTPSRPPLPTDHKTLLKLLREAKRPVSPEDLLPVLGLHRRKRGEIDDMLKDLVAEGKLIQLGRAYGLLERMNLITGKVQIQRSGVAFLIPDDPRRKDVFLGQDTAGAWHGDRVAVAITREHATRNHEGRVVRIVERGRNVLPVRVMRAAGDRSLLCRPTDPRLDFAILAEGVDPGLGLHKGDIALAAPGEQLDPALWAGVILSRLGPESEAKVQESLVKANHGVPTGFPDDALAEAAALPQVPAEADYLGAGARREDLRALPFVTIDGKTARDFDDAVFVEKKAKGYVLWVAIADVAHYVPLGSALDREAYERGNSYYFPSSVEPMFPQALSNGLCSLNPGVPRLSMVVRLDMTARGTPGEVRVMNAVILSHARLTYSRARDVCVDKLPEARAELLAEVESKIGATGGAKAGAKAGAAVLAMLDAAEALARKMRQRRIERGSLDFDLPEGEVQFDADGQPTSVIPKVRHFAHQLIEEFMIAANEAVSEFLQAHALPCMYRVHAAPDREKLETLYTLLARLDGEAAPKRAKPGRFSDEDFTPEALGRLLASVSGSEREFLVHRMVLRSMKQAKYQPENEGHYGLASESYAHFTSPIRRYADLIVHRLLKRALGDHSLPVPGFKKLAEMGQHLSARERVSQEAERECHKRYVCLVLRGQEGREFAGVVTGLMDYGFWVELTEVLSEGFIRLSTMLDDYYGYFKEREMLLGQRTGRVIRAGQAVRVKLIGAHLDRLEIDLEMVLDQKGAPRTDGQDGQAGSAPPRASRRERQANEDRRRTEQARQKRQGQGKSSGSKSPGGRNAVGQKTGGKKAGGPKSGGKPGGR